MNDLICGDVIQELQKIQSNLVDLTITSPPYNKRKHRRGKIIPSIDYDSISDDMPEDEYQKWQVDVLDELYRVAKDGGSLFYNHKIRWNNGTLIHPITWLSKTKWTIKQEIVWDRIIAANLRGWRFWQAEERIYWLYKPDGNNFVGRELQSRHAKLFSVWRLRPEQKSEHPAAFPISIPTRIIYSVLDETKGATILDPFCGSGTTLVAAKALGHNFIGIDLSPRYLEICKSRLENIESEMSMIKKEMTLHVINKKETNG